MAASVGRSVDIELNNQEVITIDLDNLDPEPKDVLDLLRDGHPKVWVWTKVAAEYWTRGYVDAAERIAREAIASMFLFREPTIINSPASGQGNERSSCASSRVRPSGQYSNYKCSQGPQAHTPRCS